MATLKDKLTARNGQQIETAVARIFGRGTMTVAQERDQTFELIARARALQSEMIARGVARAFRPVGRLVARIGEGLRARHAANVLSRLDDRTLNDIGIFRAEIDAIAHRMAESGNDNRARDSRHAA